MCAAPHELLPFSRPSITELEVEAAASVLRSGWLTSGPKVEAFEQAFASHSRARHAVAVSSATAGFHLLLRALGIGAGDEVVTPSLTWPSAVNAIEIAGAHPVFADIDRRTLQLDPAAVARACTARTRAVIPVHFGGQPCDLDALRAICRKHGAVLIEDAAHAAGTEHCGAPIGGGGNPAVFSFHAVKNLTTGEGGMITTGDESLRARLASLRFHGVTTDAWQRHRGAAPGGYDLVEPGFKQNLTDLQAAIGLVQLERLQAMQARREEVARRYDALLDAMPELERPGPVAYPHRHSWHLYQVLVDRERTGWTRDELRAELRRQGIGTGLHFLAVHQLDHYRRRYPANAGALPATEHVAARTLSLPLFPDMAVEQVDRVAAAMATLLRSRS